MPVRSQREGPASPAQVHPAVNSPLIDYRPNVTFFTNRLLKMDL